MYYGSRYQGESVLLSTERPFDSDLLEMLLLMKIVEYTNLSMISVLLFLMINFESVVYDRSFTFGSSFGFSVVCVISQINVSSVFNI